MRPTHLFSIMAVGLFVAVGVARAQFGGVRGAVDRKLEGVSDYNQAIEDAMNGKDDTKKQPTLAPDALKSGWLTRKSKDGRDVRLYFAYPAALTKAKPAAGLIVVQEYWGVNDDLQQRTRDLAAKGFYAVAPDLFNGKTTDDPAEAQKLRDATTNAAALSAMKTGVDLLQEEEGNGVVDAKRVGVVGWDMGAQQALLLSAADPRIKATAIFYGPLIGDITTLKAIQGPILGIFGANDKAPSPSEVSHFQTVLRAAGKTDVTITTYEGVGHAFASKSAEKLGAYNEAKAKEAYDKLYAWLDAKLPRK